MEIQYNSSSSTPQLFPLLIKKKAAAFVATMVVIMAPNSPHPASVLLKIKAVRTSIRIRFVLHIPMYARMFIWLCIRPDCRSCHNRPDCRDMSTMRQGNCRHKSKPYLALAASYLVCGCVCAWLTSLRNNKMPTSCRRAGRRWR